MFTTLPEGAMVNRLTTPKPADSEQQGARREEAQGEARLYGVGIGPGASDLITLRARDILQRVKILAYPAPPNSSSLARSIAAPHLRGSYIEFPLAMSLDARCFPERKVYEAAARAITAHVRAGRDVAYLCEGDATLYGSFLYLLPYLRGIPIEIVPGVSSPMSGSALWQSALAQGEERFSILPASAPRAQLEQSLVACESAVFMKVGRHFAKICALLKTQGRIQSAYYISHATFPQQRSALLTDLLEASSLDFRAPYFSMIFVPARATSAR